MTLALTMSFVHFPIYFLMSYLASHVEPRSLWHTFDGIDVGYLFSTGCSFIDTTFLSLVIATKLNPIRVTKSDYSLVTLEYTPDLPTPITLTQLFDILLVISTAVQIHFILYLVIEFSIHQGTQTYYDIIYADGTHHSIARLIRDYNHVFFVLIGLYCIAFFIYSRKKM